MRRHSLNFAPKPTMVIVKAYCSNWEACTEQGDMAVMRPRQSKRRLISLGGALGVVSFTSKTNGELAHQFFGAIPRSIKASCLEVAPCLFLLFRVESLEPSCLCRYNCGGCLSLKTETYSADAYSKVTANLETLNRAGHLTDLLVAVGSIIGTSSCPEHVVVACHIVWKLAASDGEPSLATAVLRVDRSCGTAVKGHTAMKTLGEGLRTPLWPVSPKH